MDRSDLVWCGGSGWCAWLIDALDRFGLAGLTSFGLIDFNRPTPLDYHFVFHAGADPRPEVLPAAGEVHQAQDRQRLGQ